jgi:hypothetical protein
MSHQTRISARRSIRDLTGAALFLLAGVLVLTAGCEVGTESISESDELRSEQTHEYAAGKKHAHASELSKSELNKLLAELRRFSAPFHNLEKAEEYGYSVNIGCIDERIPLGMDAESPRGMGYHITRGDKDIITDGTVNAFEPEFLVYGKDPKTGKLKLGAFDYFVPGDTWADPDNPPVVLGIPMHWSPVFQGWVLHSWHFWNNPDGIFMDYNPDVPLCEVLLEL